ncbi:pseudouridine synthase [Nitrincola tapanii]|uniref:tRNA pseudouridine synthase C n=1 Tax=Nitrincola tapanii TaxID=1708751 RepID=A0A5A9W4M4_9GAMM|nr:pseudouridine synthase [Nitrincola tapanii]KAA0875444.1 tRNA pseudouridine(65) synthase TruC [Nitrincola tapanii]
MTDTTHFVAPEILYQDEYILALHKPAGVLVHPSWIAPARTPNLVSWLKQQYPEDTFHTLHRLDRATSGVIVFVRNNKELAQKIHTLFEQRKVKKTYWCVVRGWIDEAGTIDYALKPIADKYADHPKANPDKEPKDAVTHYRRLACVELPIPVGRYPVARYSLVEVKPETGRKHQIRRHMKHLLHPLVGDTKHGEGRHNRLFREHFAIQRLLLMATEISFEHPDSGQTMHFKAPLDAEVCHLLVQLGWQHLLPRTEHPEV